MFSPDGEEEGRVSLGWYVGGIGFVGVRTELSPNLILGYIRQHHEGEGHSRFSHPVPAAGGQTWEDAS